MSTPSCKRSRFEGQTSGELIDTSVIADADSVVNVAVGVEQSFSGGQKLYGGFHTDFSAARQRSASNSAATGLDIYHASGGMTFTIGGSELTAGAVVSFGETTNPFRVAFILGYRFRLL